MKRALLIWTVLIVAAAVFWPAPVSRRVEASKGGMGTILSICGFRPGLPIEEQVDPQLRNAVLRREGFGATIYNPEEGWAVELHATGPDAPVSIVKGSGRFRLECNGRAVFINGPDLAELNAAILGDAILGRGVTEVNVSGQRLTLSVLRNGTILQVYLRRAQRDG